MHFLDTSAVLELCYGTPLGRQIQKHIGGGPVCISSLTVHELDILIAGISQLHNHELITCDKDFLQIKELEVKIF